MRNYKSTSLADQVFDKLENDIIQGVYQRGELLTELKLVEQLGVSRTPIREAMRRLEQERLIRDSGKGSVVLGITREDLEDIMNIRQRIEGLASYYATLHAKPEEVTELRKLTELQDFYYGKGDLEHLRQAEIALQMKVSRATVAEMLDEAHRKLADVIVNVIDISNPDWPDQAEVVEDLLRQLRLLLRQLQRNLRNLKKLVEDVYQIFSYLFYLVVY